MIRAYRDPRCSAEGCMQKVGRGKLFCLGHYVALPRTMRDELWRARRAAMENWRGRLSQEEQLRRERAYGEAFRAAQEYLRGAPTTPVAARTLTGQTSEGEPVTYGEGRML